MVVSTGLEPERIYVSTVAYTHLHLRCIRSQFFLDSMYLGSITVASVLRSLHILYGERGKSLVTLIAHVDE